MAADHVPDKGAVATKPIPKGDKMKSGRVEKLAQVSMMAAIKAKI
jgi:hypothetical protein